MGIGTSRGAFYDDEFQHQAGIPALPKGDEEMVKKPSVDTGDDNVLPPDEGSYNQPTKGLTRVYVTKPDVRPEPDYMNPPEGNAIQGYVKGLEDDVKNAPGNFVRDFEEAKKKGTKLNVSPEDINTAIDVGMGSGVGAIKGVAEGPLSKFLKSYEEYKQTLPQAKVEKPLIPMDETEQAIKSIMDALEGPGTYEAKYGKSGFPKTMAESDAKFEKDLGWTHVEGNEAHYREYFAPKPEGHTGHSFSPEEAAAEYKVMKNYENQVPAEALWNEYSQKATTKQWKEFIKLIGNKYTDTPKTDSAMKKIKAALDDAIETPLNASQKIISKIEEIKGRLMNQMLHERAEHLAQIAKDKLPKEAIEAGYDTPAYRGLKNRDEIKAEHNFNKSPHQYSSDSPLLADMYSDYLSKHPGWNVKEGAFAEGATVAPLVINTKNYHVYDAKGVDWQSANGKAICEARDLGKPGVIVKNVYDEPNSTRNLGKPNTVYITLEQGASTVKSKFAKKFDPDSRNMLHMVPVIGVGGAAGYVSVARDQE